MTNKTIRIALELLLGLVFAPGWGLAFGLVFGLALGCGADDAQSPADGESGGSAAGSSAAGSSAAGSEPDAGGAGVGASDAAYADVVAVATSGSEGEYTFGVSVESADIDCSQYADFWEVLSEDGALLYRRILEHSHTDENGTTDDGAPGNTFTRDGGPVDVSAAQTVIVRAHMSTTGYRGRVMRGSVSAGFEDALDIDASFAVEVESEPPQPDGCLF